MNIRLHKTQKLIPSKSSESLMQNLLAAGIPVASSCGGEGVCGKCRLQIVSGSENLSAVNDTEELLRQKNKWQKNDRFSCQTYLSGDCEVDASYW